MMELIKLFFESNVILGAVQYDLLETDLQNYVETKLIKKPQRYQSSKELLDYVFIKKRELNIEPFVSRTVREEIRNLVEKREQFENKIINKLRIEEKIKELPEEDRKLFELILYKIFFIKLPAKINNFLDQFSSIFVDQNSMEETREDIFHKIFRSLLKRHKYLKVWFEQKGLSEKELKKDSDHIEYCGLSKGLDVFFKFRDYKQINDLRILAEAVYMYRKMKDELKKMPDFYFVSCDHLFIPFNIEGSMFFDINNAIENYCGVKIVAPKYLLERVLPNFYPSS